MPDEAVPSIHVLVNRVLADLPAIGKDAYNQQQKFHFRGVDAVLNAINPLLARHGVTPVPHKVIERVASVRQTKGGTAMYEVSLHVQFRLYGPAGDFIEAEAWGEGTDMGDKATSKAHTAAQKVMLIEVFNVSTEETATAEPDRNTPEDTVAPPPPIMCPQACGFGSDYDGMTVHLIETHGWVYDGERNRAVAPPKAPAPAPPPATVPAGPPFAPGEEPF